MNKTAIIVLIIIILGGIWWFASSKGSTTTPSATSTPTTSTGGPISMRELWTKGDSVSCTFESKDNNQMVSGMMYLASGKVRGDFQIKSNGGNMMESHMISDGKEMWTWTPAMAQGMHMMMPEQPTQAPSGSEQALDWDKKVDYKCSPWSGDSSKFAVPTNIKFMDLNAMMPKAQ